MHRVAFWAHPQAFLLPGGGEVQLRETLRALKGLGEDVVMFAPWGEEGDASILHVFGLHKDNVGLVSTWKTLGRRVVVSPIFYALSWVDSLRTGDVGVIRTRVACYDGAKRYLLRAADFVLPNSEAEARLLVAMGVDLGKVRVVRNAVAQAWPSESVGGGRKGRHARRLLVLGRFESRKNQLRFLRWLDRAKGEWLEECRVLGRVVDRAYFEACSRFAGGQIVVSEAALEYGSPEHLALFRWATTVVVPSWYETPGLVGLEGASMGCEVWCTNRGCAAEYFERAVPFDPFTFRELNRAREAPIVPSSWQRVSWAGVAAELSGLYRQL